VAARAAAANAARKLADTVLTDDPFLAGLALAGGSRGRSQPASPISPYRRLRHDAARQRHRGAYRRGLGPVAGRMHTLDAEWFAPVLAALGEGRIQAVTLVLGGETTLPSSPSHAPTCASSGAAWARAATGAPCCPTWPWPPEPDTERTNP
jgi:hypothetical protein